MLLIDRIFDGEGKAHVHFLLLAERIGSVLWDSLVFALKYFLNGHAFWDRRIAVAALYGDTSVDAEDVALALAHHPFLSSKYIGDVTTVETRVVPIALCIAVFRLEQCGGQHSVVAVSEIALGGDVNTIVAASTIVDQMAIHIELTVVDERECAAHLYWHIEDILVVRLDLDLCIFAQLLGKRERDMV